MKIRLRFSYVHMMWAERSTRRDPRVGLWTGRKLMPCGRCGTEVLLLRWANWCEECKKSPEYQRYLISSAAHRIVQKAVRKGLLPKLDGSILCTDCTAPAAVYDHREYAKPLAVEPVCKSCNVRRGPATDMAPLIEAQRRARL
jgi:hypothetical protein